MLRGGAALLGLLLQGSVLMPIGDFTYAEAPDPINDSRQVSAVLRSGRAELTIGCDQSRSHSIFVVLETHQALTVAPSRFFESFMPFNYRVDHNKPDSDFSRYGATAAILENATARGFAQALAGGSSVYVRVAGLSGDIDASFSASEARAAMQKVAERCGDNKLLKRLAKNP